LGREEKFFAAAGGGGIEFQDAGDERVGFAGEICGWNDPGDQTDFKRLLRSERLTEEDERKSKARESVFAEISHDGGGGEAVGHFGEAQRRRVGYEREVGDDGQAHAETEGVALDFGNGDQRGSANEAFELDEAGDLGADGIEIASGAFAAGAENFAAGANSEDACAGPRGFGAEFGEHGVEHGAGDFVAAIGIDESESEDFGRAMDFDQGRGVFTRGRRIRHGREIIHGTRRCVCGGERQRQKKRIRHGGH
jgi:hypothetical protein